MQNSQKEEQNRQATIQVKIMEGRFHYLRDLYLDAADAALVNKEVKNLIAALQEEDPKAVFDYIASLQKGSFKKTEPLFVAKLTEIYRTLVKMKKVKEQDKQEKKEELKGLMGQLSNIKSSGFSEEEQENLKRWYEGEFMRVLQSRPDMADDFSNVLEEKSPVGDNMQERVRKEFLSKTEREWVQNALRGLVSNKGLIFAGASAEDKDLIKATIPLRSFLMQHLEAAGSYIQHLLSKSDPTNAAALEWLYANMCWVQGEVQALRAACAALEAKKASAADQNVIDGLHVQVGEQAMHLIRLCVSSPEAELYIRATLENISPEQAIFKKALTEVGDKLQHIRPINTLIEEVTTLKSKFTAIFKADSEEALNAVSSEVMDIPQENPDMKEEELAPLEKERQKKLAALTHRKDIASKELADLLHSQPDIVDYLLEPNASHEVVLDVSLSQKERQRIDAQLRALHILGSTQEVQEGVVSEEVSSDLRNYLVQNAERAMPYMWKLEQRYKSSALTQLCQKVDETLNKSEAALTSLSQLPYSTKRASLSASVAGSKMFAMSWPTPDQKHGPEDYYKIFKKDSGGNRQYCFTSAFRVHGEVVSCSEDDPQNYEELESVLIQALEKGRNPLSNAQKEKVRLFLSGFMQKLSYIGKKPITDRKIIGQEKQSDARKQDFMRYILKQIAQGDWTAVVKQDCYYDLYFDENEALCLDVLQVHGAAYILFKLFSSDLHVNDEEIEERAAALAATLPDHQRQLRVLSHYTVGTDPEDGLQYVSSDSPLVQFMLTVKEDEVQQVAEGVVQNDNDKDKVKEYALHFEKIQRGLVQASGPQSLMGSGFNFLPLPPPPSRVSTYPAVSAPKAGASLQRVASHS